MNIIVIGAGAWGTALGVAASRASVSGRRVTLWTRDAQQAAQLQASRVNDRYLPGAGLPAALGIGTGSVAQLAEIAAQHDLIVAATPIAGLRALLQVLQDCDKVPLAWVCKGFELPQANDAAAGSGLMPHEICAQVAPRLQTGSFSGPSFAQEVALGRPTALVAASAHAVVRDALVRAFHGPGLRVYENDDIVGVEVGGAVKNVLAIATGLCDGLQLGLNARAALITRGLAEMTRLGLALGARAETFMGLSGLGDLVLTATGELSRNRRVGLLLAQNMSLPQALATLGHVAEGVPSARTVLGRAQALGVPMPITESVVALLDGRETPQVAVERLMRRDPASESD